MTAFALALPRQACPAGLGRISRRLWRRETTKDAAHAAAWVARQRADGLAQARGTAGRPWRGSGRRGGGSDIVARHCAQPGFYATMPLCSSAFARPLADYRSDLGASL